jgi:hypothetical protein
MYRICFDSNDSDETYRYLLHFDRSRENLAKIPGGPKQGMQVTIYMIGEIEMEATLEWNERWNCWVARPLEGNNKRQSREVD